MGCQMSISKYDLISWTWILCLFVMYLISCIIGTHCLVPIINTLRPRQDGRHFPDDIFKCIFLNENVWILIKISLKFVPEVRNNNIPALVQMMDWCRPGEKPLSEPMIVELLTHICVTQPQWVNSINLVLSNWFLVKLTIFTPLTGALTASTRFHNTD